VDVGVAPKLAEDPGVRDRIPGPYQHGYAFSHGSSSPFRIGAIEVSATQDVPRSFRALNADLANTKTCLKKHRVLTPNPRVSCGSLPDPPRAKSVKVVYETPFFNLMVSRGIVPKNEAVGSP
jgi:hypothetical protein